MTCKGNAGETCGGPNRLSVFVNTTFVYPSSPTQVGSYTLTGCYQEPTTGGRLLSAASYSNTTGMTVESCVAFCQSQGSNGLVAGVEYYQQCFCAPSLPSGAVSVPLSECNYYCTGNNKEFCGGSWLLDVYTYTPGAKKRVPTDFKG